MEKARIHVNAAAPDGKPDVPHRDPHCYEEVSGYTEAEKCGCAPFDYAYLGGIVIRNDEGEQLRLQSFYSPEMTCMVMMTQEHYEQALAAQEQTGKAQSGPGVPRGDDMTGGDMFSEQASRRLPLFDSDVFDERYDSLGEAAASDLFFWFLEIDDRIDKKIQETLNRVRDTRYWPNAFRAGGGWTGGKAQAYMEAFNDREPGRQEYFQILRQDGRTFYSATHASIFMRMELGNSLYSAYFGDEPEPEYWFRVDSLEKLKEDRDRLTQIFTVMLHLLHRNADPEFMKAVGMNVPELEMLHEEISLLSGRIREAIAQSRYEDALKDIDAREHLLDRVKAQSEDIACSLVSSLYERSRVADLLDDTPAALGLYRRIYAMKDSIRDMEPVRFEMGMSAFHLAESTQDLKQRAVLSRCAREWLKDDHPEIEGQLRSRYSHIATLLDTFYRETGREKDREALARKMKKQGIPFEDR